MTNSLDRRDVFDQDLPAIVLHAQLTDRQAARDIERLLGDLWVNGDLDVLDGRLLDWPPESPTWQHRAPYNVPRLAPLPASVWNAASTDRDGIAQPGHALARLFPGFAPGVSAICAVCSTSDPERARDKLIGGGRAISLTVISGRRYQRFRHRANAVYRALSSPADADPANPVSSSCYRPDAG